MQRNAAILLSAVLLILGMHSAGLAQSGPTVVQHGTFGPRVLGAPLQPKATAFGDNFVYGPSGDFRGLRRDWELRPIPTDVIVPATVAWPDLYQALQLQPSAPVSPVPVPPATPAPVNPPTIPEALQPAPPAEVPPLPKTPEPTGTEPAGGNSQELPLRRGLGAATSPSQPAPAAVPAAPRPVGPQSISPLQTPGGTYTTFRTDFPHAVPSPVQIEARLTSQLNRSLRPQTLSPIQVSVQGQTAVLRGTVASSYDRAVAEQMVRMEAGIWNIDNQLKVSAPPTSQPSVR